MLQCRFPRADMDTPGEPGVSIALADLADSGSTGNTTFQLDDIGTDLFDPQHDDNQIFDFASWNAEQILDEQYWYVRFAGCCELS